jgi:hypothetical protein
MFRNGRRPGCHFEDSSFVALGVVFRNTHADENSGKSAQSPSYTDPGQCRDNRASRNNGTNTLASASAPTADPSFAFVLLSVTSSLEPRFSATALKYLNSRTRHLLKAVTADSTSLRIK